MTSTPQRSPMLFNKNRERMPGNLTPPGLTPPGSPTFTRNRHSFRCSMTESGRPSSPTIRMNMDIDHVPAIATRSLISTPPTSPALARQSAGGKQKLANKAPALSITTIATPPLVSISSNEREQPVVPAKPVKTANKGGKRKMPPGCGLLDWIRLCRKNKDLAGTGGEVQPITQEELAKHCTEEDAWTAIRGNAVQNFMVHDYALFLHILAIVSS